MFTIEVNVLKFLHEKHISHMDLKPSNILLTSIHKPILKLAGILYSYLFLISIVCRLDFGVAQHIGNEGGQTIRGTLLYMAPEMLSRHPYDSRVDLWSMGIILYGNDMIVVRVPFLIEHILL
jgi:serine/threonine-protein kinase ULK3